MESIESRPKNRREVFSWIFYDFANTIFSMNVVSMYFPLWMIQDLGREDIWVSGAHFLSMALVAFSMPVLGAISDQIRRRMPFLIGLTVSSVLFTALIGLVGQRGITSQTRVLAALFFFVVANYCYHGGLVFYNALLPQVSTPQNMGRISGYGVALGYLGAIVGLILVMPFNEGSVFGIQIPFIPGGGRVATFVPTGFFFFFFALPTFLFLRDRITTGDTRLKVNWAEGFRRVGEVMRHIGRYPGVFRFLVAKFCYENAISAVIVFMAVYAVRVMGFSDNLVMPFFIVSTISAILGSLACGWVVDRLGPKRTLILTLIGWIFSLCLVLGTNDRWVFWGAGSLIGIFMGSTWTSARPLLVTLVPGEMLGEFFGLYSFSGKTAAIFGPLIWGLVVLCFRGFEILRYKFAVGALLILICVGLAILWRIPDRWSRGMIFAENRAMSEGE
jgi:UMF1 family MFS transporter